MQAEDLGTGCVCAGLAVAMCAHITIRKTCSVFAMPSFKPSPRWTCSQGSLSQWPNIGFPEIGQKAAHAGHLLLPFYGIDSFARTALATVERQSASQLPSCCPVALFGRLTARQSILVPCTLRVAAMDLQLVSFARNAFRKK